MSFPQDHELDRRKAENRLRRTAFDEEREAESLMAHWVRIGDKALGLCAIPKNDTQSVADAA